MSDEMVGPPVSRPPAMFEVTECGGISSGASFIVILALLLLVMQ